MVEFYVSTLRMFLHLSSLFLAMIPKGLKITQSNKFSCINQFSLVVGSVVPKAVQTC